MAQSELWNESVDLIDPGYTIVGRLAVLPSKFLGKLQIYDFLTSWRILRNSSNYEAVITVGYAVSFFYGILKALRSIVSRKNRRPHLVLEFWLPKLPKFGIQKLLYRLAFQNDTLIALFSKNEINLYADWLRLPLNHFRYVPFHTDIRNPQLRSDDDFQTIFSAGRTDRDHETFLKAMSMLPDIQGVLVAPHAQVSQLDVPKNVRVFSDIPWNKYLALLQNSKICVVSLKNTIRSSGHVVLLEAMGSGVPVVASRLAAVTDYVTDNETGLFFETGNAQDLRDKLRILMADHGLLDKLSRNALAQVLAKHTFEIYAKNVLSLLQELTGPTEAIM